MMKLVGVLSTVQNLAIRLPSSELRCRIAASGIFLWPVTHCHKAGFHNTAVQFQKTSLPQLPVPPLEKTLEKYLRTVRPHVTDKEFTITEQLVKDFGSENGIGTKLQKLLQEKAKSTENWLSEWWLNSAYLDFRWPVVVYSSPGLVFPFQKQKTPDEQVALAAKVILGAIEYKLMIDRGEIPLEKMGTDPLDMSQYHKIYGTNRIPGVTRDCLQLLDPKNPPKHITVAHNNHLFELNILNDKCEVLTEKQLIEQLKTILKQSSEPAVPVGIVSSENRNTWGKAYQLLKKDAENTKSLTSIERSLFLVCLDQPNAECNDMNQHTIAARQMIHGCGSSSNGGNRWFDKTVQFIIGRNGELGLCYEHSPAEGPPIANMMDHIVDFLKRDCSKNSEGEKAAPPKELCFNISPELKDIIETAKCNLDSLVDDLEMACFVYKGYGKEFPKSQKLSPDSFIQMAIQYAFYRIHCEPGAHYESASVRKYLHGRTETIRSCSIESVAFAKTMLDNSKSDKDKANSLRAAIDSHKKYAVDAVNGLGVDRHLLGLKLMAVECGMDVPKLYLDAGYTRSSHMRISTSQVAGRCEGFMCYGPLVPDGYACCYNPRANEILFGTSAFNSSPGTSAVKFREALEQSLNDMQNVLEKSEMKSKL